MQSPKDLFVVKVYFLFSYVSLVNEIIK